MPTTISSTGITFPDATALTTNPIPSGTVMIFRQSSAPTGWTKITSGVNDMALRVVTGSVADRTNGTAFSTVMSNKTPSGSIGGGVTNTVVEGTTSGTSLSVSSGVVDVNNGAQTTVATSSLSITPNPHSHSFTTTAHGHNLSATFNGDTMTFNTNYVDVILATKN